MIKNILACAIVLLGGTVLACSRYCTDMGCLDALSGTIKTEDGTWSEGSYVITITANQTSYECSMQMPENIPDGETSVQLPCQPELTALSGLVLEQDTVCTSVTTDNSVGTSCEPVPGKYSLSFLFDGTPEEMTIQVKLDGTVLVEEELSPSYEENQPNGKGCGPVCKYGAVEVVVP